METYSIAKVGKLYVVRANDRAIIAFTSRRRAARVVADAMDLLCGSGQGDEPELSVPSMGCDRPELP
jgi:hypothetical protein